MVRPSFHADRHLSVGVSVFGPVVVVDVAGEIDMATRDAIAEPLFACLAERPPALVLDLVKIDFIGSAGLRVLVDVQRCTERATIPWRLVARTQAVLRPLDVSGLQSILPVSGSLSEALDSLTLEAERLN